MGPKIVHKSHCALHPLQVQWCARTALFILVCGSSRECDLRLTQMALVTLQLFSRLWQYKSQAFLCTSSCPAMACMLAFFFACARCCFRRARATACVGHCNQCDTALAERETCGQCIAGAYATCAMRISIRKKCRKNAVLVAHARH